jgi:hypothetical protein
MRVYWWQGGLHADPETADERQALMSLWNGAKRGRNTEDVQEGYTGSGDASCTAGSTDLVNVDHCPPTRPSRNLDD